MIACLKVKKTQCYNGKPNIFSGSFSMPIFKFRQYETLRTVHSESQSTCLMVENYN